ncbi:hypothetical protein BgiMline_002694 [Biomphalaria glabrata]
MKQIQQNMEADTRELIQQNMEADTMKQIEQNMETDTRELVQQNMEADTRELIQQNMEADTRELIQQNMEADTRELIQTIWKQTQRKSQNKILSKVNELDHDQSEELKDDPTQPPTKCNPDSADNQLVLHPHPLEVDTLTCEPMDTNMD